MKHTSKRQPVGCLCIIAPGSPLMEVGGVVVYGT